MSRTLIEQFWCDPCDLFNEQANPADEELVAAINGPKFRRIDTCIEHRKTLTIDQLVEVMTKRGAVVQSPRTVGRPSQPKPAATPGVVNPTGRAKRAKPTDIVVCPGCHEEMHRGSYRTHAGLRHDVVVPIPDVCPECGRRFPGPQSMAGHRHKAHNHDPVAEVMDAVRNQGWKGQVDG